MSYWFGVPALAGPRKKGDRVKGIRAKNVLATLALGTAGAMAATALGLQSVGAASPTFLGQLRTTSKLASTVPANGDLNPYGVAVVSQSMGKLVAGDTLVSNFNANSNVQGTGTTIVQVPPGGPPTLFANLAKLPPTLSCPGGIGLTTGLGVLPGGWVVVGSLPTAKGGALPGSNPVGCLVVLDSGGNPVETITNQNIVGPWDMVVQSSGTKASLFVSNALGGNTSTDGGVPVAGNCTVVRVDLSLGATAPPAVTGSTVIGQNFPWRANKTALVLAPTGLALAPNGTLYVDDTQTNAVSAIPNALNRTSALNANSTTIASGGALDAPLGMVLAPNGDLVVVNGNNGNAVELRPSGKEVAVKTLVRNGGGDLFGIATTAAGNGLLFVNDGTNTLNLLHS